MGAGYQRGALFSARFERDWLDWFRLHLSASGVASLNAEGRSKDQFGTEYDNELTGAVYPIVGAGGFLHFPRGFLRHFGIGLEVEGFYYDVRLESKEVLRKDRTYIGTDRGTGYNFKVPILSIRIPIGSGGSRFLPMMGFDFGARLGGSERTVASTGASGFLFTDVNPNRGVYLELLAGFRY